MQKIIVNSTPLIVLGNTGYLWVLKELYGKIIIPQAVFDEVTIQNNSAGKLLQNEEWIIVDKSTVGADRKMYRAKLHAGEVEVMILAQKISADIVHEITPVRKVRTMRRLRRNCPTKQVALSSHPGKD